MSEPTARLNPEPMMPDDLAQFIASKWPLRRWIFGTASILSVLAGGAWWIGVQIVTVTHTFDQLVTTLDSHTTELGALKRGQEESRATLNTISKAVADEAAAIAKLQGYNDGQRRGDIGSSAPPPG